MFERLRSCFFKKNKSGEIGSKKRNRGIHSGESAAEVTDDSLGNVAVGQSRPDPKKTN